MVDSNPAGLEARMLGCLEPWRLVGFPLGWQGWIGLDVSGCWIGGGGGIGGFLVFSHARRSRRSADCVSEQFKCSFAFLFPTIPGFPE